MTFAEEMAGLAWPVVIVITLSMQQPNFPAVALIFLISNCSLALVPLVALLSYNWFNGELPPTPLRLLPNPDSPPASTGAQLRDRDTSHPLSSRRF